MNKPLRHVWLVVAVIFLLLFGSTTYFQVIRQNALQADGRNMRTVYNEFNRHRGPLVVGGEAIASSTPSQDQYGYQRSYTDGPMYAPATGYYSVLYGFSGIERAQNETLSGESDALFFQRITDTLAGREPRGASVELTLNPAAQRAAWKAMKDQRGAVVALDPSTGAILAMVSAPSYDPNALASHDISAVQKSWAQLNDDAARPMTNRAIAGNLYPPGSTFKLLVAAAALQSGQYTAGSEIPGPGTYRLPGSSSVMNNFSGGKQTPCGPGDRSTLADALRQSCNTSFAMLGTALGEKALTETAQEFGFGQKLSIPQTVTRSSLGENLDKAQLATTSIGQFETKVTPLQMAMVASAVVDDGTLMQPQLIKSVRTQDLTEVEALTPRAMGRPLSAANAAAMRSMMVGAVQDGTGRSAAIDGVEVGGKTGTAQWAEGRAPHSWFVGYAKHGEKSVAVAVVVEEGGYGSRVAAPIAKDVMEAVIRG